MKLVVVWALGCAKTTPEATAPSPSQVAERNPLHAEAVRGIDSPVLQNLVSQHWDAMMRRYPQWANELGDRRFADKLYDRSPAAHEAWLSKQRDWVVRLTGIPDGAMSQRDQLSRDLLLRDLRTSLSTDVCQFGEWSISARSNVLVDINSLAERPRLDTERDAQQLLARYRAVPGAVRQTTENLRRGLAEGRVGIRSSIDRVVEMLDGQLAKDTAEWPLADPIDGAPDFAERDAWRTDMRAIIDEGIRPALAEYRSFLADELVPKGREGTEVGIRSIPDGAACYEAMIEYHTTLSRTADELHELGLGSLRSIHEEFRTLGSRALGTDDLATIFERLRTDPSLRFDTADEVQQTAEDALARAREAIPAYFGRLPQADCIVEPVPDYLAPHTTIAYYQRPRPDGSRPGIYYINVHAPETRPRHEAEVLAFHESIPGHHLQIAIAQEVDELPAFRRYGSFTAFIEGWALYTERLSDEMGLYTGDTDRLGMLSFDAWRASRLVVDTGLHAKGWSREQAETFMEQNTPLAVNNIVNEVDRYVTTPGQALAYKVGQIEIARLRDEARARMKDEFSYPEFHDRVLEAGAVPLPVLAERVERWLAKDAPN